MLCRCCVNCYVFFFFSSRRRHTRFDCDWSSDVCSSDLLYHRLLDAGRTLSNDEPDQNKERQSRPATGDSVHVPAALQPGATGAGPRVRYPTWDELQSLTPEQRRLDRKSVV